MSFKIQAAALLSALATTVSAHGHVTGIVADGTYYLGYDPSFQYQSTPPSVVGWSCPQCLDNGFVDPTMYTDNSKIACHKDATAGQAVAKVAAGGTIDLQWSTWPDSHKGPVLDYLAKVDDATKATTSDLSFFKIDQDGLDSSKWASDKLIANNNTWTVTIPTSIAAGQYVLRHEIIALHSAGQANGAQNYPQCINIEVTSSGTESPAGVQASTFYTPTDPGILVNIYSSLTSYDIPGPALFGGASSGAGAGANTTSTTAAAVVSTSAPVATSTVSSAPVVATSAVSSVVAASSSVTIAQAIQTNSPAAITSSSSSVFVPTPVATEAPAVTSDVAAPIISQIAGFSSVIPSGFLTSVLPTAAPTGGAGNYTGDLPTAPLPEGITLKDLLDWVSYIMHNMFNRERGGHREAQEAGVASNRNHPRAF
ncbi:lytic polysaccharide monooxygenase [Pleomassaria siparia CBS 279.74]|uniref:AA9 family lytic polysaccharide monooxygenase n=1 Tax=Pleomassaria siparia CBS 279.74 TaxID=1314801 RepID=A0A6G1KDG5_9PLEO|nr:lytic polysaccharide monooxygenase [Pleomassaria siparia CBS 279.74]